MTCLSDELLLALRRCDMCYVKDAYRANKRVNGARSDLTRMMIDVNADVRYHQARREKLKDPVVRLDAFARNARGHALPNTVSSHTIRYAIAADAVPSPAAVNGGATISRDRMCYADHRHTFVPGAGPAGRTPTLRMSSQQQEHEYLTNKYRIPP